MDSLQKALPETVQVQDVGAKGRIPLPSINLDVLVHLGAQLSHFTTARLDMIEMWVAVQCTQILIDWLIDWLSRWIYSLFHRLIDWLNRLIDLFRQFSGCCVNNFPFLITFLCFCADTNKCMRWDWTESATTASWAERWTASSTHTAKNSIILSLLLWKRVFGEIFNVICIYSQIFCEMCV